MPYLSSIDDIVVSLSKSKENLLLFCGAGISINSGIPSAIPLLENLLDCLQIEKLDKAKLIKENTTLAMPFEAFCEVFLENSTEQQFLNIFTNGEPNTTHFFLEKCYNKKILKEIYTTNFDLLIEKAFALNKSQLKVFSNEDSFQDVNSFFDGCKLIKVHGSIDELESLRTTVAKIANRKLSSARDKIIEKAFNSTEKNTKVLIIGYSCSDIFDIIPKIEKIFNPKSQVFLLEHDGEIINQSDVILEKISIKAINNPFVGYSGIRIKVNTDYFIKWFWEKIDIDYKYTQPELKDWKHYITEWSDSFKEEYTKSSIIGQLFYQISDYSNALKYHQKAFNTSKSARGKGASLSNIGLINHDLKQYTLALENHMKANSLFLSISFLYGIAASFTNMGYAYIYIPDKIKAILNLKKSLRISRKNSFRENKKCESDALCNLGLLYEKNGEYANALYYYFETLEIDKLGNKLGEAQSFSDIGRVFLLLKNNKKSLFYFKKSFDIATKLGTVSLIKYSETQITYIKSLS